MTANDPLLPPPLAAAPALATPVFNDVRQPAYSNDAQRKAARMDQCLARVGFWPRLAAVLLDIIVVGIVVGVGSSVFPALGSVFPLVFIAYTLGLWSWKGTTIGGAVMRLRVQRVDGGEIDVSCALVRLLVSFLSLAPAGLGWFWASWNEERQAWHDIVAGTIVVRLKPGVTQF